MEISKFLYFALVHFQFDAMILDFVSWSVYWQLIPLFTSRIGQLWTLARLNNVRDISMLSAKIGERRKQVTARYHSMFILTSFNAHNTNTFLVNNVT